MNNYKPTTESKIAVSLNYDGEHAPRVTAKGDGIVGNKILKLAYENDIPVHEDSELVQALSQIDIGSEIPEQLFLVVAEILAFIYFIDEHDNH